MDKKTRNNFLLVAFGIVLFAVLMNGHLVAKTVGYTGAVQWDESKPDGTPRKLLNVSKLKNLGWQYKTELEQGIALAYEDFLTNAVRTER